MDRSRFKQYGQEVRRDWAEWLADDPPSPAAKQSLRQARVQAAASYLPRQPQAAAANPVTAQNPDLTININLQKIRLPKPKLPKVAWAKLLPSRRAALVASIVVIAAGAYFLMAGGHQNDTGAASAAAQNVRSAPSFKPVAPATEPQLGNFAGKVTAYDGRRDIYSYADSIAGNRITISEQKLPQKLGSIDQALQKVAAQVGASAKINTKNGEAYIKTDKETGAQVVVCSAGGLMLFINSSTQFQDADWVKYIDDLQ